VILEQYLPVLVLFVLALLFAIFSVIAGAVIGPKRYNKAKEAPYESGIDVEPIPKSTRFPIKFYLTAMLFIIFDIEIVLLYPWAVAFSRFSGWFGLLEMVLFLLTVFVAYAYVWRRGGLEWD